jgi:hypothetical protein
MTHASFRLSTGMSWRREPYLLHSNDLDSGVIAATLVTHFLSKTAHDPCVFSYTSAFVLT